MKITIELTSQTAIAILTQQTETIEETVTALCDSSNSLETLMAEAVEELIHSSTFNSELGLDQTELDCAIKLLNTLTEQQERLSGWIRKSTE